MRFHKLRMITKDGGSNVFATSSKLKRIFSIVSFVLYFAIVSFVLFHINHFPNGEEVRKYAWISLMVIACWLASRITNLNLHLSFSTIISSFIFAIIMHAYVIAFVLLNVNKEPATWEKLLDQFYWWIPILGWGALWKLKFAIFEYKARPYFAIKKLLNFIVTALIIGLLVFGIRMVDKFAFEHKPFDYIEEFPSIIFIFMAVVLILLFGAAELFYFNRFGKSEIRIKKVLRLWTGLLQLGTITVWLVYETFTSSSTHNFITWGMPQWILIAVAVIAVAATLYVAFTRKEAGGGSRVFVIAATSSIFVLIITSYIFQFWWGANMFANAVIVFIASTIIIAALAFIEPRMPWGYSLWFSWLVFSLVEYALIIWLLQEVGANVPLKLDQLIFIPPIGAATIVEAISVVSYWWTISRIGKYSSKSNQAIINPVKGANHE